MEENRPLTPGYTALLSFKKALGKWRVFIESYEPKDKSYKGLIYTGMHSSYRLVFTERQVDSIVEAKKIGFNLKKWPSDVLAVFIWAEYSTLDTYLENLFSWLRRASRIKGMDQVRLDWKNYSELVTRIKAGKSTNINDLLTYRMRIRRAVRMPTELNNSRSTKRRLRRKNLLRRKDNRFAKKTIKTHYALGNEVTETVIKVNDLPPKPDSRSSRQERLRAAAIKRSLILEKPTDSSTIKLTFKKGKQVKKKKIPF